MKIKDMIKILKTYENQDAEIILAFEDGIDNTTLKSYHIDI